MIIELNGLAADPKSLDAVITKDEIDLGVENARLGSDVSLSADAVFTGREAKISGRLKFALSIDCSRCLQPVETKFDLEFDAVYVTADAFAAGNDGELSDADLDVDVLEGDAIDLGRLAKEQILLSIPEQIYCREDCRGLCPKCGKDRNLINCSCEEKDIDPRWSALKNLK